MVSTSELLESMGPALDEHFGVRRRVVGLERKASDYQSSYSVEELEVVFDDGTVLPVVFKDLSRQSLSEGARRAKPRLVYEPRREIETYRAVLAPRRLGPVFYGSVADDAKGRYWLFLEKVNGPELYKVGDAGVWRGVARWLCELHTSLADEAESFRERLPLINYEGEYYRLWIRRAQRFLAGEGGDDVRAAGHDINRLAGLYEMVIERLLGLPKTFIHGEFYASNVLVSEGAGALRVCPVDWEMAGVGPGLIDLAALTSGGWTDDERAGMASAYYAALPHDSGWFGSLDEMLDALEYCRLYIAVQWLGWFGRRRPAPQHAHDWLGEAVRLAERLPG